MKTLILSAFLAVLSANVYAADKPAPKGPVKVECATCNDGKVMYCVNPSEHRGACSGHGGVASWADGSEVKSHARKTEYK